MMQEKYLHCLYSICKNSDLILFILLLGNVGLILILTTKSNKIKDAFLDEKKNYKLFLISSIIISLVISFVLMNSGDISSSGAVILGIFQIVAYNTLWLVVENYFRVKDINKLTLNNEKTINNIKKELDALKTSEDRNNTAIENVNILLRTFFNNIEEDLKFHYSMQHNLTNVDNFYSYISKLKLQNYFAEYFIFDNDSKIIKDIPTAYFEKNIWEKFVRESKFYYSIQSMTIEDEQSQIYLKNTNRQNKEINILFSILDSTHHPNNDIKKIFIVDDDFFQYIKDEDTWCEKYFKYSENNEEWNKILRPILENKLNTQQHNGVEMFFNENSENFYNYLIKSDSGDNEFNQIVEKFSSYIGEQRIRMGHDEIGNIIEEIQYKIIKTKNGRKYFFSRLKEYLHKWYQKFSVSNSSLIVKLVSSTNITKDKEDIGIFGNVYGIQSKRGADQDKTISDPLSIDFYFDKSDTEQKTIDFKGTFQKATDLSEIFSDATSD